MAAITVRNLDDDVRDRLRLLAASHGHSMEAEVRSILTAAVGQRRVPNALTDLYWVGWGELEVEIDSAEPSRDAEAPRVDFTGAEFG